MLRDTTGIMKTTMNFSVIIFLLTLIVILSGCQALFQAGLQAGLDSRSPDNQTMIVNSSGVPDIKKKVYVNLVVPKASDIFYAKLRTEYIPTALKAAGINNYQILPRNTEKLDEKDAHDAYLLTLLVSKWDVSKGGTGTSEHECVWLPAHMKIYELPEKKELIELSGESKTCKYFGWNAGDMIRSLFTDMLNKAYKG